jgi:hypothetical protein
MRRLMNVLKDSESRIRWEYADPWTWVMRSLPVCQLATVVSMTCCPCNVTTAHFTSRISNSQWLSLGGLPTDVTNLGYLVAHILVAGRSNA